MKDLSNEIHSNKTSGESLSQKRQPSEAGFRKFLSITWNVLFNKPKNTRPNGQIPVTNLTRKELLSAPNNTLFRLGHSTILLKLKDEFWITDPVFSKRASPVQWAGPKRFHQPPITIEELPPIKGVILSHDHYDHLDHVAVMELAKKTEHFLTTRGVGDRLIKWGISADKIQQLGWWDSTEVNGIEFVATPAKHFSGRTLSDRNQTLWASWVIIDSDVRIFFSGDSGYFAGFKEIGKRYGPFDLTMMETGAYNENWPDVHMHPEESLQAHIDVNGKWMMPIHNGTFDLAMHTWYEPFERILALGINHDVLISTPSIGEALNILNPHKGKAWWRNLIKSPDKRIASRFSLCLSGHK